jgi:hypothetical protein
MVDKVYGSSEEEKMISAAGGLAEKRKAPEPQR